jgi:hypothetical protein
MVFITDIDSETGKLMIAHFRTRSFCFRLAARESQIASRAFSINVMKDALQKDIRYFQRNVDSDSDGVERAMAAQA